MKIVALLVGALMGVLLTVAGPAEADTENCVSRGEYDATERGWTPLEVARRYDVYGQLTNADDREFRRSYRTCWAPGERRVVVEFDADTNSSVDWFVRDV